MNDPHALLDDLTWPGQETGDGPVVCLVHRKRPPCVRDTGCQYSSDPEDVRAIELWQRGGWALPGC